MIVDQICCNGVTKMKFCAGSAMGTIPQRTGRGRSFGVSIIVIFIYYLLLSVCGALAQAEILSPFVGAWLPNLCGLGMGILILMQFSQK